MTGKCLQDIKGLKTGCVVQCVGVLSDSQHFILNHMYIVQPNGSITSERDVLSIKTTSTFKYVGYIVGAIRAFSATHNPLKQGTVLLCVEALGVGDCDFVVGGSYGVTPNGKLRGRCTEHRVTSSKFIEVVIDGTCSPDKTTENKYLRTIMDDSGNTLAVDVYAVLEAFPVKCPAVSHAVKKMLCGGHRGHKDALEDIDDVIKSMQRARQLEVNRGRT